MTQRVTPTHAEVILEMARQKYPDDAFVIISEQNGIMDITCNLESGEETIRCLKHSINCIKEGMEIKPAKDVRID